ncbi:lamin tail domain-containing protein [Crocinitomicaceae bacterium]|nr:lamin tail domain-containing protein [Crocinitomicaceae bacterium]
MKKIIQLFAFVLLAGSTQAQCTDLFFSEYIEGSSSNKAFEIYNPTPADIDLSDYVVYRNNNGSLVPTDSLFPAGMILAGDVYVVGNPSAVGFIPVEADTTHTMTFYNGDDALYLVKISTGDTLDLIGEIGVDPGSGWTVGAGATNNFTLIRMQNIQQGTTIWTVGSTQWDVFPIDMDDSLGSHTMIACGAPCTPTSSTITPTQCDTYTAPDGMVYTSTGSYTAVIPNAQGCDSTITVNLTINTATSATLNEVVCDSFALNGTTYNFSGTYTQTLTNVAGCDSVITLNLDVTATPSVPVVSGTLDYCDGDTATALTVPGAGTTDSLIISGVMDATLPGGLPKVIEFYAIEDISDLSTYGFGSANNGGGSDGEEYTFPAVSVTAGTYIHVATDSTNFNAFLGFFPDFVGGSAANINGDDAIELFHNGAVIDVFGDINTDGTGQPWEYLDGWAYRKDNAVPNGGTFILGEWDFSGIDALDNQATNAGAPNPFPVQTYAYTPQNATINWYDDMALTNMVGTGNSFTPGITSGSISYYVTASNTGGTTCASAATQVDVTFNAPPSVVANATATSVCEDEIITLNGSGAATYQWDNGVTDGVPFPVSATTTYIVIGTDQFGCTGTDSVEITVTAAPATTLAAQPTFCDSDAAFTLSGGTPAGGTYSGTGVSNGDFDPSVSGIGTFTITYSYLDTTSGCTGTSTADLIVNDCASIAELEAEGILVYPNPATDVLNVQTISDIKTIEVVDLSGMIVANGTENSVSVANLASGMYVINVTTETGMFTKTFLKK